MAQRKGELKNAYSLRSQSLSDIFIGKSAIHERLKRTNSCDSVMPPKKSSRKPKETETEQEGIDRLTSLTDQLVERIKLLENIVIKYERKCLYLEDRITDLTARSMKDNIIISNVKEENNEDCGKLVAEFVKDNMEIDCAKDVLRAHRMGTPNPKNKAPRPLVAKLNWPKKEEIMNNTSKLRGKKGAGNKPFFVSNQEPEAYVEKRKKVSFHYKYQKALYEDTPGEHRPEIIMKRGHHVKVNGEILKSRIAVPTAESLIKMDDAEREFVDKVKYFTSKTLREGGSKFTGYSCAVNSINDVRRAYARIKLLCADADDVMMAYSIDDGFGKQEVDYYDDREVGGGYRCWDAIRFHDEPNVAVFVARHFDGVHIGPIRFKKIWKAASLALQHSTDGDTD